MNRFSKTWWGQRFIAALESFTDAGRLQRGRSYAGDNRIKKWQIMDGLVKAEVRGNVNPYFGVYQEPTYRASMQLKTISGTHWNEVIKLLSSRAAWIAKLMTNEMPETIEDAFVRSKVHLLPENSRDFDVRCSCPDYEVPCKHVAGLCYRLASQLDRDPFLLFELRGLAREKLQAALAESALGQILATTLGDQSDLPSATDSYYTRPIALKVPDTIDPKAFWTGEKPLPKEIEAANPNRIAAMLIKKGGDYPAFWDKQSSFISVMEEFYERVRKAAQI
jgi:uncharacterized Zn finger protein